MIQQRGTLLVAALVTFISILLLSGTNTPDAAAQLDCGDGSGDFEVSTAGELNAAITCINETTPGPGGYQISLLNNIEAAALADGAVFEPLRLLGISNPSSLQIEGNGFVLSRSLDAPNVSLPLLSLQSLGDIDIFELGLSLSAADVSAIDFDAGRLGLWAVGIDAVDGSTATGIVAGEFANELNLRSSSIEGVATGIVSSDAFVDLRDSTIRSTGTDVFAPNSGFIFVDNSTFAGPVGLSLGGNFAQVANSTILGNGLVASEPDASVVYRSSIVGSCSALIVETGDFPPEPPEPLVVDFGTNAGGCFDSNHVIDTELADNGCQVATPFGCPRTVRLSVDSPAVGIGDCSDAFTDQRDVERTPVGPGCDAGAFEIDDCASTSSIVGTEAGLNAAISCFNDIDAIAGSYVITLANDIVLDRTGINLAAVLTPINQPSLGFDLTIDGAGHEVFAPDPPAIGSDFASIMLTTEPTNAANLTLANISLESRSSEILTLIYHQGSGSLSATQASLGRFSRTEFNLNSIATGGVVIDNTIIGSDFGILVFNAPLSISDSSFTNRTGANNDVSIVFQGNDALTITSSTFDRTTMLFDGDVMISIHNSTFSGSSPLGGGPNVTVTSSLINDCSGDVIEAVNNVVGCFDLPAAQDNGCALPTPTGCPPTVALDADSPALGAGECTGVPTDQRGEPRTPAGPGCDAGAFEFTPVDPPVLGGDADCDGQITIGDALIIAQFTVGLREVSTTCPLSDRTRQIYGPTSDINGNDQIDLGDALLVAQCTVGINNGFCPPD